MSQPKNIKNNPIPILSKKNVKLIEKIIDEKNIDTIIEYGSGSSTLYFIKNLKKKKIKFRSVENNKWWFYENIKNISKTFTPKNCVLNKNYWNKKDYKNFYETSTQPFTEITHKESKIKKIKDRLRLGIFSKYEKYSNSKLSFIYNLIRPLLVFVNSFIQNLNKYNNEKSEWKSEIDELEFTYKLISPAGKDQFGENPNRDDYVDAGIKYLENETKIKNILVMIDGGPRHYIVDRIINKKYHHRFHICLFDAYRPEYKKILDKYKGTFFPGEDKLLDNTNFYSIFPDWEKKFPEWLAKELWYFDYQP